MDQAKNLIIGVFAIAALTIVIFIILFLHPSTGNEGQTIYVRFSDIDKVNVGTRVTFAGKAVGEVSAINDIEDGRYGPRDSFGHLYVYQLTLLIDSSVEVYTTDEVSLRTSGLLGERSVAITPVAPPQGVVPKRVTKDDILYAIEVGNVEDAVREFKVLADKFEETLTHVTETLEDVRKEEVIKHIGAVAKNLSDITLALNQPENWAAIVENLQEMSSEIATRIPSTWDTLDATLDEFYVTAQNSSDFTKEMDNVVKNISKGEGSVGRLVMRDDIYVTLKGMLAKVETIADDVNHYGLLFQTDKGWQRLRSRRMNLLQQLSTPQEFRNYFNEEINQISTSISRVSMVLDEIDMTWPYCCPYPLMDDPNFAKVFAELLRRVETMEESLRMYNVQLSEQEATKCEIVPAVQECCWE